MDQVLSDFRLGTFITTKWLLISENATYVSRKYRILIEEII